MQDNLEVLNEHLETPLANAEREQAAGAFSVDLVAEDDDGRAVVIQNQLERSNHDHLGKLLTYLAAYEASTAIWIVAEPRAEHVKAVAWLNDSSQANVYLLKVEAVRIGASTPAPLHTKLVGPSPESRDIATTKQERSKRHELRRRFWTELLARAKQHTRLHATISPGAGPYLSASAGKPGFGYYYGVAELRLLRGQQARTEHLVGDLAEDVRDVRTTVDRTAARELDTAKVVSEAKDWVFTIYTDQAQGTAFAVFPTDDGGAWLATNSHVVEDALGADRMVRLVQGNRSWRGEVATWQDRPDVALIRVAGELPTLSVAVAPTVGDQVLAYGSPFELPDTVTKGIVSAVRGDYIQTDAQINHGNSGGPLLNVRGEVVGITTYDLEGGGSGLGLAISMPAFCKAVFQDGSC